MEDLVTLVNQLGEIIKEMDDLNSYTNNKTDMRNFIERLEEIRSDLQEYDYK